MPTRPTSADAATSRLGGDQFRGAAPADCVLAVPHPDGQPSLAADESEEIWLSERTMVTSDGDQTAGSPCVTAEDFVDEIWVSEATDTPGRETAPPQDEFVSETSAACRIVAVAVPVSARRVPSLAPALTLGVVTIVGSLGLTTMFWPITPAGPPSVSQPAPPSRSSNPAPRESGMSVTREASVPPPPSSSHPTLTQNSAAPVTPVVQTTRTASVATAPVTMGTDGQLRVTSAPSGARVTVNGIGWGHTPLTIDLLPPGMKTVRVTREGYASQEFLVDIRSDRPAATLHVTLDGEAAD